MESAYNKKKNEPNLADPANAMLTTSRASCYMRTCLPFRNFRNVSVSTIDNANRSKQTREAALAEAMAKEEEAVAREKVLRELNYRASESLGNLNSLSTSEFLIRGASMRSKLADQDLQDGMTELDSELKSFFSERMKLPSSEVSNRPWYIRHSQNGEQLPLGSTKDIVSTIGKSNNQFPNLKVTLEYKEYSTPELYLRHLNFLRKNGGHGSVVQDVYLPWSQKSVGNSDLSVATLLAAGCHLGHAKASFRPSMQRYVYGESDGLYLIDLNETMIALTRAIKVVRGVALKGGVIVFVGTNPNEAHMLSVARAARKCKGYYVSHRWIPGTITNFVEVSKQLSGQQRVEVDLVDRSTDRKVVSDSSLIKPDLVILMNPVENRNCISECISQRIPTIGLCDTDMEPSLLTYPIPCNDDSVRVWDLILQVLSSAGQAGIQERHIAFESYSKSNN